MRKLLIGLTAALLVASVAAPAAATRPRHGDDTTAVAGHKVVVCHRSSSLVHPFVVITVDIASSGGMDKVMGHYDHVWDLNKKALLLNPWVR